MLNVRIKSGMLIALSGVALSGCFEVEFGKSPGDASGTPGTQATAPGDPAVTGLTPGVAPPSISTEPPSAQARNAAPSIAGNPPTVVAADERYEFRPSASDSDGDELRFSATGLPGWAGIDAGSGVVSGTPRAADAGQTADIVVSVSDGKDTAELNPFRVAVMAPPAPPPPPAPAGNTRPVIGGSPGTSVQAQSGYSFRPSATDVDGQALTFSISNKPSWAAFSTATGTLSGTPARDQEGTYGNIVIGVSDGALTAMLPAFTIVVSPPPNSAPTINGSPATSLTAETDYSFRPGAADADGDTLTFSISNKPAWASFDTSNGILSGTPLAAQAGTYGNIVIRVNDGRVTTALPAFSIVVNPLTLGSASLSWAAPTQNTDGSTISNLSGYRIYYGTNANSLDRMIQVSGPGTTNHVVDNLRSGTYFFAVSAYNNAGAESDRSTVGSKAIP
jgi:hypothetical protein